jgi:hypothetical protein
MEKWVLEYWDAGLMVRRRRNDKIKMDNILWKTNIPSFHYSIIP